MKRTTTILALPLFVILSSTSCYRTVGVPHSVGNEPPYGDILGNRYRLSANCYVVLHSTGSRIPVIYPENVPYYEFPPVAIPESIGKNTEDGKIVDILPKGSIITVVDVQEKRSYEYHHTFYYVTSADSHTARQQVLNAYPLFTSNGKVPEINTSFGVLLE